MGIEIFV